MPPLCVLAQLALITVIGPVIAPEGTTAVIWLSLTILKDALTLLPNFTPVTLKKPTPLIVTVSPTPATAVDTLVIEGHRLMVMLLLCASAQFALLTVIGPIAASTGTVAVICESLMTVNAAALALLLNFTAITFRKPDPLIVTLSPTLSTSVDRFVIAGQLEVRHFRVAPVGAL